VVLRIKASCKTPWRRDYSGPAADFGNSGNNYSGSGLRAMPKELARVSERLKIAPGIA
jgi:hypothetical protein